MKVMKGNLVDLFLRNEFNVIVHGCNCFRTMGAGIAKEIAEKIPEAYLADKLYGTDGDISKLSSYSYAPVRRGNEEIGIVINLYTQYQPGRNLCEEALLLGFIKLKNTIHKDFRIGIPMIGCGIAGGNWTKIGPKISSIMENHDITVVQF